MGKLKLILPLHSHRRRKRFRVRPRPIDGEAMTILYGIQGAVRN